MSKQVEMSPEEQAAYEAELQTRYDALKGRGLALDMTRGKPAPEQLDLANDLLSLPGPGDYKTAGGVDCRNYGGIDGIPEAKALFAEYMGVSEKEIILGGTASLALMHDTVANFLLHTEWGKGPIKFICPAPGYDRHFDICKHFGIGMIPVPLTDEGPDMDQVESLVAEDSAIKGIWCVPRYSNPTGTVYSDAVVDRLAGMSAASDFRIFWDNAYAVHTLTEEVAPLRNLLEACREAGHPNRAFMYGSTSKISFAGMGVSMVSSSEENLDWVRSHLCVQTIGPDKINQLRHVRFFKDHAGILAHMQKHAAILRPKFEAVDEILTRELGGRGIATWTRPQGGYFVSLETPDGCAKEVVALAGEAGIKLTGAGATFPHRNDPRDSNIRIAPSQPCLEDIRLATEGLALCVELVSARKRGR